jgi:hypothetical protein
MSKPKPPYGRAYHWISSWRGLILGSGCGAAAIGGKVSVVMIRRMWARARLDLIDQKISIIPDEYVQGLFIDIMENHGLEEQSLCE